jgi:hypothetical protein
MIEPAIGFSSDRRIVDDMMDSGFYGQLHLAFIIANPCMMRALPLA